MSARKIITDIVVLLLIMTLAFIWGNSLKSVQVSGAESGRVLLFIGPLLEIFVGKGNATDHVVRKIAHFSEFGLLGCELALLIILRRRIHLQPVMNCLSAGLAAAVTDEALQYLSGRGSQVTDVLLDFSGVTAGIALVLLIGGFVLLRRTRRKTTLD